MNVKPLREASIKMTLKQYRPSGSSKQTKKDHDAQSWWIHLDTASGYIGLYLLVIAMTAFFTKASVGDLHPGHALGSQIDISQKDQFVGTGYGRSMQSVNYTLPARQ